MVTAKAVTTAGTASVTQLHPPIAFVPSTGTEGEIVAQDRQNHIRLPNQALLRIVQQSSGNFSDAANALSRRVTSFQRQPDSEDEGEDAHPWISI